MSQETIAVFTALSLEEIVRQGGSSSWVLDPTRAGLCKFVVCTRNAKRTDRTGPDLESHRAAFLVGRVSGLAREPRHNGMGWLIRMSEYAPVDLPEVWKGWRNPVKYTTLGELGIRFGVLKFQPMPKSTEEASAGSVREKKGRPGYPEAHGGLSIAEAKRRLAISFGVGVDAIEITIRG